MKRLNFKVLLLISLFSGFCFKASATTKNDSLVKYKPISNDITENKEITEYKENNDVSTTTKKESREDQGKIYNLILKTTNSDTSTCEEKIYFDCILKILENEFNKRNSVTLEGIFKNLNVDKNNGKVYVNFEVTVPNEKNISTRIFEFAESVFNSGDMKKTKENLNKIISNCDLKNIMSDKYKIIDNEIEKLNKYEKEVENEYREKNLINNPMQDFFGITSMFDKIGKIFDNSFFSNNLFNANPFENDELNEIKKEAKKERKEQEKSDIKNKIREKKARLIELKNKGIEINNLKTLINNIESLNLNGNYFKISKSISSVSKNTN